LNRRQFSVTRAAAPAIRATHSGGVHRRAAFLERQSFSCELRKSLPTGVFNPPLWSLPLDQVLEKFGIEAAE